MPDALVITGVAYGRRATLEVTGDTLMWRAQRGARPVAENIATTVHDVRNAHWVDRAWSRGGLALLVVGVLWAIAPSFIGFPVIALGVALIVWRRIQPRQFLVLDVGDRRLMLRVGAPSVVPARALVYRIQHALATGEVPLATPTLP